MRRQKKIRSLRISYARQQMIYRTCQNYERQNEEVREKIRRTARAVCGGENAKYKALMALLVSEKSIRCIALEHYYDETVLYRLRKAFYEKY